MTACDVPQEIRTRGRCSGVEDIGCRRKLLAKKAKALPRETHDMPLFEPCDEKINSKSTHGHFAVIGYREYAGTSDCRHIDAHSKAFRNLIQGLKDGAAGPIQYFGGLLDLIFDEVIQDVDLIACVPGSKKTNAVRNDPIARIIRENITEAREVLDGTSLLQRLYDVPKAHEDRTMRSYAKQLESIGRSGVRPAGPVTTILLIDDVYTSGATMAACHKRLKEAYPAAEVIGFAFGVTPYRAKKQSPAIPQFPSRYLEPAALMKHVDDLRRMASRCDPYGHATRFVMNGPRKKIHTKTCRTVDGATNPRPLKSVRDGLRQGGQPCGNCMSS